MGDPRKARKTYATPRHPWRKEQLEEELRLLGEYGLRNKRELRHQETLLSEIRGIARTLLGAPEEQRARLETQYLGRLARLGLLSESASVDNILDLNVKDLMERRLQTIVFKSGLSRTIHQARQFVTHGHVSIAGQIVSVPGYFVKRDEESRVAFLVFQVISVTARGSPLSLTTKKFTRFWLGWLKPQQNGSVFGKLSRSPKFALAPFGSPSLAEAS